MYKIILIRNVRLKKQQHYGGSIGSTQRHSGGGAGGVGDIRNARPSSSKNPAPSRLNPNTCLSEETQIQRSQGTNQQKENIGSTKQLDLMENNLLQDELVKAVKTHFQDSRNWQKVYSTNVNKVPSSAAMQPPKEDSSDDEIEGTIS